MGFAYCFDICHHLGLTQQLASTPTIGFLGNNPLADPASAAVVSNSQVSHTGGLENSL